jgi:hypothetical protein
MNKMLAALAAATALLITGCGSASPATTAAHGSASSSPPSCHQQYETWKHGPAKAAAGKLVAALKRVQSAGSAEDITAMDGALKAGGSAATALAAMPIPRCADPAGYYSQMLTRITAAGDNAKTSSGLAAMMLAMVPLKSVPGIEKKLSAELARTVGKNH